ncbi:peptidylprolyl isomerase [Geoalkalibacter halelectricus]|uniref:Peptidylprolyl isomerase n=1 Tax=Geoalkalibacter halelectricus TaxID=2847045 RepID=A0ABY5ZPY3_9BACT|nr:peptidylprolyl isomerase [Geoalkalibacter halelectricus]UWZ80756.1 peptidylprolyl isomerase [Geoalkalibacter halelectricus]
MVLTKKHKILSLLLFFALLLAGAPAAATPGSTNDAREVAALVNGVPIYLDQVEPLVEGQLRRNPNFAQQARGDELLDSLRLRALNELINVELLYQAGSRLQVADADEQIAQVIEYYRDNASIAALGEEQMQTAARRQVYINAYYVHRNLGNPEVPEELIRAFYEKNKEDFSVPPQVEVRHILAEVARDGDADTEAAARKRIEEARARLLSGEPFSEIAQDLSDCGSAPGGGELGSVQKGFMPKEFEEVAFALTPGEISPVVRTDFGFHVFEILSRNAGGPPALEEMRDFFTTYLQKQVREERLEAELATLREQARIEIFLAQSEPRPRSTVLDRRPRQP